MKSWILLLLAKTTEIYTAFGRVHYFEQLYISRQEICRFLTAFSGVRLFDILKHPASKMFELGKPVVPILLEGDTQMEPMGPKLLSGTGFWVPFFVSTWAI